MDLDSFYDWLKNTSFSSKPESISPQKYKGGVRTISSEMLEKHVIRLPLEEMTLEQLEIAIFNIFHDEDFIKKNTTGHHMYSNALKYFRAFLKDSMQFTDMISDEVCKIESDESIETTEKESLINSRIGQGKFRKRILDKYDGICIVSRINDSRLLVASHVKPWSISDNEDRLSSENGLLLNSLYDKMFDLGLMTFTEKGEILVSKELNPTSTALTGIKINYEYNLKYTPELLKNMEYHRDVVFLKG